MSTTDAAPGDGAVEIILVGSDPVLLKCTVGAALRLCRQPGGLESTNEATSTVTSRLLDLDIPTMAEIIRAGLDIGQGAVKTLEEQIFKTGLLEVRRQLAPYVGALKNGGKPLTADDEGGEASGEENPPNG